MSTNSPMTEQELIEKMARAIFATQGMCHTDDKRMFEPVKWEELDDDDYQCVRAGYRQQAIDALSATTIPVSTLLSIIKGGAVVVPVEPTEVMANAAWKAIGLSKREKSEASKHLNPHIGGKDEANCIRAYRAMIEARPK
ncbi:MAG: hypothetical protein LCH38_11010 [Proteobacteria bacterium]|nr:hypothetical protein [Pseudomonadota bacterium]